MLPVAPAHSSSVRNCSNAVTCHVQKVKDIIRTKASSHTITITNLTGQNLDTWLEKLANRWIQVTSSKSEQGPLQMPQTLLVHDLLPIESVDGKPCVANSRNFLEPHLKEVPQVRKEGDTSDIAVPFSIGGLVMMRPGLENHCWNMLKTYCHTESICRYWLAFEPPKPLPAWLNRIVSSWTSLHPNI